MFGGPVRALYFSSSRTAPTSQAIASSLAKPRLNCARPSPATSDQARRTAKVDNRRIREMLDRFGHHPVTGARGVSGRRARAEMIVSPRPVPHEEIHGRQLIVDIGPKDDDLVCTSQVLFVKRAEPVSQTKITRLRDVPIQV